MIRPHTSTLSLLASLRCSVLMELEVLHDNKDAADHTPDVRFNWPKPSFIPEMPLGIDLRNVTQQGKRGEADTQPGSADRAA